MEKVGKYMINSNIKIEFPSKDTLRDVDCLVLTISPHEKFVFTNEVFEFVKSGVFWEM